MSFLLAPFRLFQETLYVRIDRETLAVRDVRIRKELKEPALVALSNEPLKRLLGLGEEAAALRGRAGVTVLNPFQHPRSPLSDFTVAEVLIMGQVRKLRGNRWFMPAPFMVMHVTAPLEGGLTQIEIRALKERGLSAGGSRALVWEGPMLTDEQILNRNFPATGEVLD